MASAVAQGVILPGGAGQQGSGPVPLSQIAQGSATVGQCLIWNGAAWAPATCAGVTSFNTRTGAIVPGSSDYSFSQLLGMIALNQIPQAGATVNQCLLWNGTTWTPGNCTASVSSYNGRAGVVVPVSGDYTFSLIGGSVTLPQISQGGATANQCLLWNGSAWAPGSCVSGAGGTITGPGSSTAGFLPTWNNGVGTTLAAGLPVNATPAANTVVEAGAASTIAPGWLPMPAAAALGGVLSISPVAHQWVDSISNAGAPHLSQPTFPDIMGTMPLSQLSQSGATVGQCATWSGSAWIPGTCGSGGGGGGATMGTQLGDLQVTQTNATTLTIGANCSVLLPCNISFGSDVYTLSGPVTVTLSAGTGYALIYLDSSGALTVATATLTVSCGGACSTALLGSFPVDSIPIANWHATSAAWDTGSDLRAILHSKNVYPGTGLLASESGGHTTVSIDLSVVATYVAPPASSSSACSVGQKAADTGFNYECVATNTWRRVATSSW